MKTSDLSRYAAAVAAFLVAAAVSFASDGTDRTPEIHGTVRGKYEYQPQMQEGRFQVRNARVSISGDLSRVVSYKAEIDLCDEGVLKMLDAYARFNITPNLHFTIGQMRVPFTIDAHRSPHQQYFANRSFIAKEVGNVRDVGAQLSWSFGQAMPVTIAAGLFNGSGLTNQKDFWTDNINFSAKARVELFRGFNVVLSAQKIRPDHINVMMYAAGAFYDNGRLHAEAEYLYKTYAQDAFTDVYSFDGFLSYMIPIGDGSGAVKSVSPLVRYDSMNDHSDGIRYLNGVQDSGGVLVIRDYARSRITGGVTISLDTPFVSDIRLNYEKYFYREGAVPDISEQDKFVVEFMVRF